jgi:arsenate reductase (thioredoxin)
MRLPLPFCLSLLLGGVAALAQPPAQQKVVFVCEHGAAKSVIAAAEFKQLAKEKGLNVEVLSRGTDPDATIPDLVRDGLRRNGLKPGNAKPVKLSAADLKGAAKVISFGPDLKQLLPAGVKASDWSATPAPSKDYQAARAYILKQLEALAAELKR